MFTLFYILLSAFITWNISKLYWSYKFKLDIKFIQAIVENTEYVIKEKKIKKVKEVLDDD